MHQEQTTNDEQAKLGGGPHTRGDFSRWSDRKTVTDYLVLEDSTADARLLQERLRDKFTSVTVVQTVEEGMDILRSGRIAPDVIFADIHLPGRGGIEFYHDMKRNLCSKTVYPPYHDRVIFMSGTWANLSEPMAYGFLCVIKPSTDQDWLMFNQTVLLKKAEVSNAGHTHKMGEKIDSMILMLNSMKAQLLHFDERLSNLESIFLNTHVTETVDKTKTNGHDPGEAKPADLPATKPEDDHINHIRRFWIGVKKDPIIQFGLFLIVLAFFVGIFFQPIAGKILKSPVKTEIKLSK